MGGSHPDLTSLLQIRSNFTFEICTDSKADFFSLVSHLKIILVAKSQVKGITEKQLQSASGPRRTNQTARKFKGQISLPGTSGSQLSSRLEGSV